MRSMTALLLLALAIAAPSARPSLAGDMPPALATGYGNGVHAYNEGDYQCSYDELSRVIEAGSNDPRVFYFRGLAALKLGRMDEADADFQQGANLEADGVAEPEVLRRRRPEPVEPVPAPAAKETEPRADAEEPAEEAAEESAEEPAAEPAAEPADEATEEPADTSDPFGDAPATEKETPAEDNAL
jgi:hypothetical protein